ncbi:homoserine kinase [Magnetovibrio blakemorei]|uniref:Homoserine kinase n=1 Tax=Magnetovibrio blakemorei TaxID=28181 RepID=A0A1E5Q7W7_9PROT|nr:homoserine kinase [Magnetovibrio blakemorei]OEJ67132.1 homoserine kinase [Magnetovibrio blakemorei]
MAVYTDISDEDLSAFVAGYGIGEVLSCKGIAEGVENSNFLLVTDQAPFILTLYEKRVDANDLPFFLGLTEHLAAQGVPCPTPVRAQDGQVLRTLSGRPAAIVTFLNGMWPKRIQNYHCAQLGRAMAQLHVAGADFKLTRTNALSVESWRPLLDACQGRGDEVLAGLTDELYAELDVLEAEWPGNLPQGIIHADLFPDNVFFRGENLSGLIDFYFACTDQFAYDVAICLNAWCFERDGDFNATKARKMLQAYRDVRDFSNAEMQALPLLARGAAMRFLLTRLYDGLNTPENALVTPKDPLEYLKKLRFHQAVSGPGAYGLD